MINGSFIVRKANQIVSFLFLLIIIPSSSCCTKETICPGAFADLIVKSVIKLANTIIVGKPFEWGAFISNDLTTFSKDCAGEAIENLLISADPSISRITINKKNETNGSWEKVLISEPAIPMLLPKKSVDDSLILVINEPGEYQLIYHADFPDLVEEWSENNNTGEEQDRARIKSKILNDEQGQIFTILPDKDFVRRPNAPVAEILARKVVLHK